MKSYTEKERQEHLKNWKMGALSKNEYAKKAGISPRTFIGWTWRTAGKGKQDFVEIRRDELLGNIQEMVIERGSITVRIPVSIGMKELESVFMALGSEQ